MNLFLAIMMKMEKQTLPFIEMARVPGMSIPPRVLHLMDSFGFGVGMPRTNLFQEIMMVMGKPIMQYTGMVSGLLTPQEAECLMQ